MLSGTGAPSLGNEAYGCIGPQVGLLALLALLPLFSHVERGRWSK
jgi:hypothetical protein